MMVFVSSMRRRSKAVILFAALLGFLIRGALAENVRRSLKQRTEGNSFKRGDRVDIIVNKVGPFNNPTETYQYYSLPFCAPEEVEHQDHAIGEVLVGDRRQSTDYKVNFREDVSYQELCTKELNHNEIESFYHAVDYDYFFEMFLDGLPIWGFVGEYDQDNLFLEHTSIATHFIFTHFHFDIGYNKNHIVEVNVTLGRPPAYIVERKSISPVMETLRTTFSYSVLWHTSDVKVSERLERYHDDAFYPQKIEIHWLAIMNSFVLVLLLVLFLSVVLVRVLKNDFTKYMGADDDLGANLVDDETGWKLIHGDVFRYPRMKMLLAAVVGAGSQLLVTAQIVLLLALFEIFDPIKRGNILTSFILSYSMTSGICGYVSARLYKQLEGSQWVRNTLLASMVVPVPLTSIFLFLNCVAWYHGSTAAVPFTTIMVLVVLFSCVSFPLTVIGSIVGKNGTDKLNPPCRTNLAPRELPANTFMRSPIVQICATGILPFSAIYIELHYMVASIWGHKMYTVFGILAIAGSMLILVVVFITIAAVYYLLISEDYRWWWSSFMYGGSTGLFVFGYCMYYFFHRTNMGGFMQTSFFFGYMGALAYMCTLSLGALGFHSAFFFVDYIYRAIKTD